MGVHGEEGRARIRRLRVQLFAVRRDFEMAFGQPMFEQGGVVLLVDVSAASVRLNEVPLDIRRQCFLLRVCKAQVPRT